MWSLCGLKLRSDPMHRIFSAKKMTTVGTWKVRTLYQCGSMSRGAERDDQLRSTGAPYKRDAMDWTRTVLQQGASPSCTPGKKRNTHGVEILLNKEAASALAGRHRISTARLQTWQVKVSIVQVYAPTDTADEDEKEEFCSQLQDTVNEIPTYDARQLMGDFNAQIINERRGLNSVLRLWGTAGEASDNWFTAKWPLFS